MRQDRDLLRSTGSCSAHLGVFNKSLSESLTEERVVTNRFCLLFCTDISFNQVRIVAHHKETSPQVSGCEPRGVRSQQLLPGLPSWSRTQRGPCRVTGTP